MAAAAAGQPPIEVVQSISSDFPPLMTPQCNNSLNLDQNGIFRRTSPPNNGGTAVVQPPLAAIQPGLTPGIQFAHVLQSSSPTTGSAGPNKAQNGQIPPPLAPKKVNYLHGEPTLLLQKSEIDVLIARQDLKWAVIGKFSHGMPNLDFLRTELPKQLKLKAQVRIGYLFSRHILIRCSIEEDYDTLMSISSSFDIKDKRESYPLRTMKYDVSFDPTKETSIAWAWVSFPNLPPVYFDESILLSIASAVGRPICVDAATKNMTRPSCAKVKVELDLLRQHPKNIQIQIATEGGIQTNSYKIQFDFLPKYCTNCSLQGHDVHGCWKLNPEMRPSKDKENTHPAPPPPKDNPQNPNPLNNPNKTNNPPKNPNPAKETPKTTIQAKEAPKNPNDWQTVASKKRKKNTPQVQKPKTKNTGNQIQPQISKVNQKQPPNKNTQASIAHPPETPITPNPLPTPTPTQIHQQNTPPFQFMAQSLPTIASTSYALPIPSRLTITQPLTTTQTPPETSHPPPPIEPNPSETTPHISSPDVTPLIPPEPIPPPTEPTLPPDTTPFPPLTLTHPVSPLDIGKAKAKRPIFSSAPSSPTSPKCILRRDPFLIGINLELPSLAKNFVPLNQACTSIPSSGSVGRICGNELVIADNDDIEVEVDTRKEYMVDEDDNFVDMADLFDEDRDTVVDKPAIRDFTPEVSPFAIEDSDPFMGIILEGKEIPQVTPALPIGLDRAIPIRNRDIQDQRLRMVMKLTEQCTDFINIFIDARKAQLWRQKQAGLTGANNYGPSLDIITEALHRKRYRLQAHQPYTLHRTEQQMIADMTQPGNDKYMKMDTKKLDRTLRAMTDALLAQPDPTPLIPIQNAAPRITHRATSSITTRSRSRSGPRTPFT